MAKPYDTPMKWLIDNFPADLVGGLAPLVGLPPGVEVEPLDTDLSLVQSAADRVFRLQPPAKGLFHVEAQASWDGTLPGRLLQYNVLLENRYGGPVYTLVVLLRRAANSPQLTGTLSRTYPDGREYLRFGYGVTRVWELPADQLSAGGVGLAPLALLTDDAVGRLPELVDRLTERAASELISTAVEADLLNCGFLLLGLRYDEVVGNALFKGVRKMKESTTYMAILEEGEEKGRREGAVTSQQGVLLLLLRDRFGVIPPPIEARVQAVTDLARLQAAILQVHKINVVDELLL